MIKEGLRDEFKRHEHTALVQAIKSVSIKFDRNQLKSLLKLRASMEQTIVEIGGPENASGDQMQCLELLNTILMDIEDIDEDKVEWIGSEVMNRRIAQLRQETVPIELQ